MTDYIGDFKVRGPDERTHIFRLEAPGKYQHYSRPVWEKNALERLEDGGRFFTLGEVKDFVDSLRGNGPITEGEIAYIKRKVKDGLPETTASGIEVRWDREIDEPEADKSRKKTTPPWKCMRCGKMYQGMPHKLSFDPGPFCSDCFSDTMNEMGRGWQG